jgi:hypothetical protein
MQLERLFSEMGKMFYAVAKIDGNIAATEKKAFETIVEKELKSLSNGKDKYGSNIIHYAEIAFDFCEIEIIEPEEAFESFLNYIELHQTAIKPKWMEICLRSAIKLAEAYYSTNQKEKILIEKLENKLQSIN